MRAASAETATTKHLRNKTRPKENQSPPAPTRWLTAGSPRRRKHNTNTKRETEHESEATGTGEEEEHKQRDHKITGADLDKIVRRADRILVAPPPPPCLHCDL
ncbi:hypothetical protein A2U01_0008696 [Trifolium medium]|uniref:Uncharacterized protein n=1 Tax=Trifolium medium TaxID=97028 RepID=A0A392ML46_9FABA|nr:hypothetical protein [Trifolium medium]